MTKKRIFSGIQPSGTLHLGNYAGAIRNWVNLQDEYECIFSVVDYHAITQPYDKDNFSKTIMNMVIDILACGVDPEKSLLFVQSDVPEHTELAWILSTVTSMGDLERMTQYKDKTSRGNEYINAGIFTYPVLQAADIVLYKAEKVPIGEDQQQHLELAREIVRRFNSRYGDVLPEPTDILSKVPRLMGLDGKKKMSKSLDNHIAFFADENEIKDRLMKAVTDENRQRRSDPGNPDICNVFTMHKIISPEETVIYINGNCRNAGIGCVDCKKKLLAHLMEDFVNPIKAKKEEISNNLDFVHGVLSDSKDKCRAIAQETIKEVKEAMGMKR